MRKFSSIILSLCIIISMLVLPATAEAVSTPAPSKITLNTRKLTLGVGEQFQLSYSLSPSNANKDSISYFTVTGSNVASVNKYGMITAKKVGTAQICVQTKNFKSDYCSVTVRPAPNRLKLNKTSVTLGANGDTFDLNHSVPVGTACNNIRYDSSNKNVAEVNSTTGKITAKNKGIAQITVKLHNGVYAYCAVTVKAAPYRIDLTKYNKLPVNDICLKVNKKDKFDYRIPSGTAANVVTYYSSNPNVVSVDRTTGWITAKKTGTATITVQTYNGKTDSRKVTVIK